jgi:6-pyruvoyltetrahydropterin/6-carboxytetrahydropterin synthase
MYEVGISADVRARHVMPGMEGPEGQLHAHDYRLEVEVARAELDERGMVCDLDVLDGALADVARRLDGADLEVIRPEGAEAVTVEVFARWLHGALTDAVQRGGGEMLSVRVWESPVAFGGYRAPVGPSRPASAAS